MQRKSTNLPATLALQPPTIRGLNEAQAAAYVGLGVTLFREIGPAPIRVRHRNIWDRLDLDAWLDEYKQRGRAKEENLWPEKKEDSISVTTHPTGGSTSSCQTDADYARALGLETETLPPSS
jgi:hypothetical protein